MSDQPAGSDTSSSMESSRGIPIRRDANFVRLPVDDIVIIRRGTEYELALIVAGPDPVFRADLSNEDDEFLRPGPVRLTPSFTEVARVRMDEGTAGTFAMNLLDRIVSSGRVDLDALRANIDDIVARAAPVAEAE